MDYSQLWSKKSQIYQNRWVCHERKQALECLSIPRRSFSHGSAAKYYCCWSRAHFDCCQYCNFRWTPLDPGDNGPSLGQSPQNWAKEFSKLPLPNRLKHFRRHSIPKPLKKDKRRFFLRRRKESATWDLKVKQRWKGEDFNQAQIITWTQKHFIQIWIDQTSDRQIFCLWCITGEWYFHRRNWSQLG